MTRKLFSLLLRIAALLVVVCACAALVLSLLLQDLDHYTRAALQQFEAATGYRVTFSHVALHIVRGAGLRIDDFVLSHPATERELLRGEHLYIHIRLSHLLEKKLTIRQLLLERPQIHVYRDTDGSWHSFLFAFVQDTGKPDGVTLGGYHVTIQNFALNGGLLQIDDALHATTVRLQECDISMYRKEKEIYHMQLEAQHLADGVRGILRYTSEFHRSLFRRSGPEKSLAALLNARLEVDNLPVRECLLYLPERFAVPVDGGLLDADLAFILAPGHTVSVDGTCRLKSPQLSLPGAKPVSLPDAALSFKGVSEPGAFTCTGFSLAIDPGLQLSGRATIEHRGADASVLDVRASSGSLDLLALAQRFAVGDPLELAWLGSVCARVKHSVFSLRELRFAAPLGAAFSAGAIRMTARMDVDLCAHDVSLPHNTAAEADAVWLELENGRLASGGRFNVLPGDSHEFDLNAVITEDLPRLNATVISTLVPGSISALRDALPDADVLSGTALQQGRVTIRTDLRFDDGLKVDAGIDATDAAWSIAGIVAKPRGVPSTIRLDYDGAETDGRQVAFDIGMGPALGVRGRMRFARRIEATGSFAVKNFSLETCSVPYLPDGLQLCGRVSGSGDFVFPPKPPELRPFTGVLQLDGVALVARPEGKTFLQADASLDFSKASGPVSVSGGRVTAGKTRGAFTGTLASIVPPVGTFTTPMECYDIDDFIRIMKGIVRRFRKRPPGPTQAADDPNSIFSRMDFTVDLSSARTKYLDWQFGPGRCDFSIRNKRLLWDSIDIEGGNGTVSGSVLYDLSSPGSYGLEFVIDRSDVDVAWAIPPFQAQQTMNGRLNLKSRFSTRFSRQKEVLGNMEGTFDFIVSDGKIMRMTLLSNILNMLNVARLFTFRMPEFSAEGTPYDTMTGRFVLKDMQCTTEDLLLTCPSMDFSVAGSFDLGRQELDLLIGVQVFRTVARIIGAVPYVGKKLTGKDKTLTLTYFRARGPFEQPRIRPVPMKVVDNAILKIFKSVRQVPQDLMHMPMGLIRQFAVQEADNETMP